MSIQQEHNISEADKLTDLRLLWQERRESGVPVTAEGLCEDCPELVASLRDQIAAIEAMEAALGLVRRTPSAEPPAPPLHHRLPSLPGYDMLGVLGQGGMGVVYKARHQALNRQVAIKTMLAGAHAGPEQLARFRTEFEAVAALRHPHVVQIHEVGEWAGQPYFTMEFVEGGSLAQHLAQATLPAHHAARLVQILAETIAIAHERGILHRDLKPANILLSRDERRAKVAVGKDVPSATDQPHLDAPKITDFGLAKRLDGSSGPTHAGAILGTPSYLAPEQAGGRGELVGPGVDIYALGAILYESLTGRPPFRGESMLDTLEQVRQREPVAPSRLQPKVPRDLETICLKCLAKEPCQRYLSAGELAADLRRFLAGEPIRARPTPWWERSIKLARRKPAWAALLVISAGAALAMLLSWATFTVLLGFERNRAELERAAAIVQERSARNSQLVAERERTKAQLERDEAQRQRERAQALLTRCVAAIADQADATQRAKFHMGPHEEPGGLLVELARYFTTMSVTYRELPELRPEDREKFAEQYAAQAVRFLARARDARYFINTQHRETLLKDIEFDPLRQRPDFASLLKAIERPNQG